MSGAELAGLRLSVEIAQAALVNGDRKARNDLVRLSNLAKRAGYELDAEYSDDGVKGADPVDSRPGFAAMLQHVAGNGVRTVIVETASRFARDLITQETGWRFLRDAGITLIAADSPDAFLDDTPTAVMIRQILGSVSQFEKAMLVAKLRGARERKKAITGKCGGRMNYLERNPDAVALSKKLARYPTNGRRRPLREVAAELEAQGHVSIAGGDIPRLRWRACSRPNGDLIKANNGSLYARAHPPSRTLSAEKKDVEGASDRNHSDPLPLSLR